MENEKKYYDWCVRSSDVYVSFMGSVEAYLRLWKMGQLTAAEAMERISHYRDRADERIKEVQGVSTVDTDKEGGHG